MLTCIKDEFTYVFIMYRNCLREKTANCECLIYLPLFLSEIRQLWHPTPMLFWGQGNEYLCEIHPSHEKREWYHQKKQNFLIQSKFPNMGQQVVELKWLFRFFLRFLWYFAWYHILVTICSLSNKTLVGETILRVLQLWLPGLTIRVLLLWGHSVSLIYTQSTRKRKIRTFPAWLTPHEVIPNRRRLAQLNLGVKDSNVFIWWSKGQSRRLIPFPSKRLRQFV